MSRGPLPVIARRRPVSLLHQAKPSVIVRTSGPLSPGIPWGTLRLFMHVNNEGTVGCTLRRQPKDDHVVCTWARITWRRTVFDKANFTFDLSEVRDDHKLPTLEQLPMDLLGRKAINFLDSHFDYPDQLSRSLEMKMICQQIMRCLSHSPGPTSDLKLPWYSYLSRPTSSLRSKHHAEHALLNMVITSDMHW